MNAKDMPVTESAKKTYAQPQIVFKQRLEAMAIVCNNPTPPSKASTGSPDFCDSGQLFS